jgi:hypothetical protein
MPASQLLGEKKRQEDQEFKISQDKVSEALSQKQKDWECSTVVEHLPIVSEAQVQ